jgi:CRISPR/Cas system-associated exonuclease Cas4 (RecB family)
MAFTWSFSSLKDYLNCPKQYHEVKVLKSFEKKTSQQMLYGTEVHKACEDYIGEGKPLPKNYQRFQKMLDALAEIPGTKYVEYKMALDANKNPANFDEGYWVRGIVDLLIVDGDTAYVVDYKTGSNKYPDPKQLKLMGIMVFSHFPEVQSIKAGLLFVMHNSFMPEEYQRSEIDDLWKSFEPDLERLKVSYEKDVWQPNPTPLCGWCPVKTCEFYKEKQ